jgi:hypothetical protein
MLIFGLSFIALISSITPTWGRRQIFYPNAQITAFLKAFQAKTISLKNENRPKRLTDGTGIWYIP